MDGRCKSIYVSEDSLTPVYLDIHRQVCHFAMQMRISCRRRAIRLQNITRERLLV